MWHLKYDTNGNSLAVQWLGLGAFTAGAWVQSLVKELRSCKSCDVAKKKKEKTQMNLSTKQKQSHRHRKQTCGCGRGREGLGVWGQQKQTIIHRTDKQQGPTAEHSALYTISCDKPVTEKKIKKNVYTCMTEPLCCTAETTTTL